MITSKNNEKFFVDKNVITIGTNKGCNFLLDLDYDILLTVQYDFSLQNYVILNTFANKNILFRSEPLRRLELGSLNRISFKNSDNFLTIRVLQRLYA